MLPMEVSHSLSSLPSAAAVAAAAETSTSATLITTTTTGSSSLSNGSSNNNNNNKNPFHQRRPMVQVVAPCNMAAGFTFLATHDGATFPVKVPPGGVIEGQMFLVPFSSGDLNNGSTVIADGAAVMTEGTPFLLSGHYAAPDPTQGRWKSPLLDCFRYGLFHPSLWNAICCPQLLMAQVLTRMRLDWRGDPTTESKKTFPTVLGIVISYFVLSVLLGPSTRKNETNNNSNNNNNQDDAYLGLVSMKHSLQTLFYNILYLAFAAYTWLVLTKLRTVVRLRYAIPPYSSSSIPFRGGGPLQHGAAAAGSMGGGIVEDVCISFWCGCCSVAQMARQTAEYDVQPAACCSRTGLVTNHSAAFPSSVLNV